MYQYTVIVGNVGKAPELRYLADGTAVTSFSVAVNKRWKAADGEQREKTTWFRVSAWRKLAEVCNEHVFKGMRVLVVGEVDASAYANDEGKPCASLELKARDVRFLSFQDDGKQREGHRPPVDGLDDIPF